MRPAKLSALAAAAVLATAGCTQQSGAATDPEDPTALGHVHGLGVDPADDTLYVASHLGVFRVADGEPPVRVADRWQDTMGFTVVGPQHFLASGHPDLRENLPGLLGLVESTDGAQTWEPVALLGEADFHSLAGTEDRVFGYDATSGRLMSAPGPGFGSWTTLARATVVDLAVDPGNPDRVLTTNPEGRIWGFDASATEALPEELDGTPDLVFLDWPTPDLLVGLDADAAVHVSRDEGATWEDAGEVPGRPVALEVTEETWYAATEQGVFRSSDDGASWTLLLQHED